MPADADAVEQLTRALEAIPRLKELARRSPERVVGSREFQQWREDAVGLISDVFGRDSSQHRAFASVQYAPINFYFGASNATFREYYFRGLDAAAAILSSTLREVSACGDGRDQFSTSCSSPDPTG